MPPRKAPQPAKTVAPQVATPSEPALAAPQATPVASADLSRLIHGAAAATLVYGDTGSGKTTLLATFAKWVWRKFHVSTRLIAADPGGYSDDVLALIRLGIIEVWRIYTRDPLGLGGFPSETLQRACQGWWPVEIDPASGECPYGARLASPTPDQRFAIAFDSLTGMQDWSMVDMGARSARGTLGGEGSNMKTVESGDMKMGTGNRASVGFTQNKARDWVLSSLSIPNLVCPPIFTALELKILDSESKLPMYGPKIAGQAKTADVPAWFGATLGVCLATDEKGLRQWRLYLRDYAYPLSDNTPHKAKIRASAAMTSEELLKLPHFLADETGDPPLTKFNLGYLFDRLEEIRMTTLARADAEFPDAPGMKKSTIGSTPAAGRVVVAPPGAPAGLVRVGVLTDTTGTKPLVAPTAAAAPTLMPSSTVMIVRKEEPGLVAAPVAAPTPAPAIVPAAPTPVVAPATTASVQPAAPAPVPLRPSPPGVRPIQRAPIPAAPAAPPPGRVLPRKT